MPPRPRSGPQPRGGPRARAATARRRVRTTSNANNVGAMAAYRRRYRAAKAAGRRVGALHRRLQKMSLAGVLWMLITLVVAVTAVAIQSTATGVAAGASLGVTAGVERYKRRKGRSGVPARPAKVAASRGNAGKASKPGTSGTVAPPPAKPINLNGASGTRTRVCGQACRQSTKPKSTCKCTAPDCKHGSEAGMGAKP